MSQAYHLTVAVSDITKSKAFYDGMFDLLGWPSHYEDEDSKAYSSGSFDYWITTAETDGPIQQNRGIGYNHLAILVDSKEKVDAFYTWLKSTDALIDIEPKAYQHYSENYYAIFFFDPDETRLEVVFK